MVFRAAGLVVVDFRAGEDLALDDFALEDLLAVDFFAVDFLAVDFLAADFFADELLADELLELVLRAVELLERAELLPRTMIVCPG